MTVQQMYDFIKTYIDKKISATNDVLSNMLSDNKVKEVGSNIDDVKSVADNLTDINTTAGSITNVNTVATDIDNVNNVVNNKNNIDTVANNIANVNNVGTNIANINNVANDLTNVNKVANDVDNIDTVATNIINVNTVSTNIDNVNITADSIDDVNTYAKTYLGAKTEDPTVRNDGSSLQMGDLYFNTTSKVMKTYDGNSWTITQQYSDEDILNKLKNVDGAESGLDADLVKGSNPYGHVFKNKIINGDFSVWQRGESFTSSDTNDLYTADRFVAGKNVTEGELNITKSTLDNKNSLKIKINSPITDLSGSNNVCGVVYKFEGQHLYNLALDGKDITISFLFKSNVSGEYSVALRNETSPSSGVQSYVTNFQYENIDSVQRIKITIPLNNEWNPSLLNNENIGFVLNIGFINNENFIAPSLNTWLNDNYLTTTNSVNWAANTNNYIEIAELQLEEGNAVTEFEHVPFDVQLYRCRRYYERIYGFVLRDDAGDGIRTQTMSYPFEVEKRTTPTIKIFNNYSTNNTDKQGMYGVTTQNVELGGEFLNNDIETAFIKLDIEADAEL